MPNRNYEYPNSSQIPTAPSAAQNIFREFPALTPQPKNLKYGGKKKTG